MTQPPLFCKKKAENCNKTWNHRLRGERSETAHLVGVKDGGNTGGCYVQALLKLKERVNL